MTDPLSVTASIAGVLSLGICTSQTLFNYYKTVQGRNEEVARITRKLQGVLDLLEWTQDEINKREVEQESDQVDLIGQVNVYIQECKGYLDQLEQEAKKFGNLLQTTHSKTDPSTDNGGHVEIGSPRHCLGDPSPLVVTPFLYKGYGITPI